MTGRPAIKTGAERRLLILDDDPLTGMTTQQIGRSVGFETRLTSAASSFFEAYETWRPTHITLDLVMPEKDGVQIIADLAARGCDARIIILSGVGDRVLDAARRLALHHGLDLAGVLAKPFTVQELRSVLGVRRPGWAPRPAEQGVDAGVGDWSGAWFTRRDFQRALLRDEFRLAYQPKVSCRSGAVVGFEALVRWQHPEHGLLSPDAFIGELERLELIDDLTERVLEQGLAWLSRTFPDAGNTLALNISGQTVSRPDSSAGNGHFADRLLACCVDQGVPPERVVIEITETSAMADPLASLDVLTRLRMMGFRLSIDDFGTGYSSMAELARLPFSEMKVDRSFVAGARSSRESYSIVRSIVDLAHALRVECTAEGVEDQATFEMLQEMGCDFAQGYLIGRPMWEHEVAGWLASRTASGTRMPVQSADHS